MVLAHCVGALWVDKEFLQLLSLLVNDIFFIVISFPGFFAEAEHRAVDHAGGRNSAVIARAWRKGSLRVEKPSFIADFEGQMFFFH